MDLVYESALFDIAMKTAYLLHLERLGRSGLVELWSFRRDEVRLGSLLQLFLIFLGRGGGSVLLSTNLLHKRGESRR